ncbi:MAG: sugar ABC transporter ATP-binding protein [Chloroflexi bacterium]|nr:MAG: sugar ABC transporter ATP-binding protein [Chloroflexota bacterium]
MARLELEQLDCWYGKTHAVDHIDLVVEDGELCVLLGPSGCGKTSTLRMIAGFVQPAAGEIYLDGQPISHLYPGDRNIAMVFQSYALYPHKTVREHFIFPLIPAKIPKHEIEQRVNEMADFLDMHDLLDRYPSELSSGQQQRVAIGRALIRRPQLFLLDEPLNNLDEHLRVEMRANLRKMQQDLRITTVYVTHDQVEAQALGDKIVVMDMGHIRQVGSPQEIYLHPSDLFVAGFIGTPPMNFINCRLERGESQVVLRNTHFSLPIQAPLAARTESLAEGKELILGVRPEHIRVKSQPEEGAIPTEVYVLEPQSNELILDLKLGDLMIKARDDKRELGFRPEVGQRVWIEFLQDYVHLFDRETEQRLGG